MSIHTRRPGDGEAMHGSLAYGSWGTAEATALGTARTGPMRWVLSGEGSTTRGDFDYLDDNATPLAPGDDGYTRRRNNESWSAALRAQGEASFGGGRDLTLAAEWAGRSQGVPGIDAYQSLTASYDAIPRAMLRGEMRWTSLAGGRAEARAGLDGTYVATSFSDPDDPVGLMPQDTSTRIHSTGATLGLAVTPHPEQRISVLVQPRVESAAVIDRESTVVDPFHAHRATLAAVIEDEVHLASGRILIAPSLRFDSAATSGRGGGAAGLEEPRDDPASWSGRVGALWALSPRWSLRGNAGRSYRIPSLLELYGNSGTLLGNPDLEPEAGLNADLGLAFHPGPVALLDDLHVEVAGFRSETEDLIHFRTLPTRQVKAENVGEARITGVESTVSMRLFDRLALSGNLTLQKAENRSDTFSRGEDLAGVPRREASTSAALDLDPVTLFHRFTYVGENSIQDFGKAGQNLPSSRREMTVIPSRYLHDAGAKIRFGSRATGTIEIVNIFDRHVVDVARYPLPGRTLFVKLEASF